MSLNKKLDKLFEADFKKIEEEDLDEANKFKNLRKNNLNLHLIKSK